MWYRRIYDRRCDGTIGTFGRFRGLEKSDTTINGGRILQVTLAEKATQHDEKYSKKQYFDRLSKLIREEICALIIRMKLYENIGGKHVSLLWRW